MTLVLKQISSNIPCCQFITWDNSQVKTVHTLLQKSSSQNTGKNAPATVQKAQVDSAKAKQKKEAENHGIVFQNGNDKGWIFLNLYFTFTYTFEFGKNYESKTITM